MFKQFVIFTLLILVRTAAAQSVYVSNQQTPVQFGKAAPDNCRFDLLNDRTGAAATLSGLALAFHPNGRLFGVFGNVLAEIDTTNGDCSAFQSATVRRFPLSGNTDFSKYNALTCDSVGIFYAVNKLGELAYFDSRTNQTAIIGVVRAANLIGDTGAGGDLIFYKNDLYLAASGRRLIKVNIQNPALSTLHMTMDCGSCFDEMASLVGFVRCNGKNVYALTTGFAPGAIRSLVYRIDIEQRTTTFVCGLPIQINDAASRYEFLPLPPDTTRVLQSTCNILKDNKTDTLVLKNKFDCDSFILTTFKLKTDTTRRDSTVCRTANLTADTVRSTKPDGCPFVRIVRQVAAPRSVDFVEKFINICTGDSLFVNGIWVKTSGTYPSVSRNIFGCDSTTNLKITVGGRRDTVRVTTQSCDPRKVGDFIILKKNRFGCDSTILLKTTPRDSANLRVELTPQYKIRIGDSVRLSANLNFTPTSIRWQPPTNLTCDTCLSTLATPKTTTNFQLTVRDSFDCVAKQFVLISVDPKRNLFIANTFSPNGDGINDIFAVGSDAAVAEILTMQIFNRWGNLVFRRENFSPKEGWNGSWNGGETLPTDVFIYFIVVRFADGEIGEFAGDVTLVR